MQTINIKIKDIKANLPLLNISSYQRATVWKGKQRASFIRSLLNEYPTGVIVLNRISRQRAAPRRLRTSHDIIDGQQRLTTVTEFMDNPLIYVTDWVKKRPHDPEVPTIDVMRETYTKLVRDLKKPSQGFVTAGTSIAQVSEMVQSAAIEEMQRRLSRRAIQRQQFRAVVVTMSDFRGQIVGKRMLFQILDGKDTTEAEQMYRVINTSGTQLLWWELLKVNEDFAHKPYSSHTPYQTTHENEVRRLSKFHRSSKAFTVRGHGESTFWDAMFSLGEFYSILFSDKNPMTASQAVRGKERRPKVDGLGFRLVSAFVCHEVNTAAINDIWRKSTQKDVRRAIDHLFDAGNLLFRGQSPKYALFRKYSRFGADVIPAYPMMGLIIAASKLVARHKLHGEGAKLTINDTLNLRYLTDQLFRESICTTKWAGSGDSKLKDWLDKYFDVGDVGAGLQRSPSRGTAIWKAYLEKMQRSDKRMIDKKDMLFHFWLQYLYDSRCSGCLPQGEPVQYDHIVPYVEAVRSQTTHPANFAATARSLNAAKSKKGCDDWFRTGGNQVATYKLHALENIDAQIPGVKKIKFISLANHVDLEEMVKKRQKIIKTGILKVLPYWLTNGD